MAVAVGSNLAPVTLGFPDLVQASEGNFGEYTGNYLARELRNICNDTKGLFPKSAKREPGYYAKNGKPVRYQSFYETDINGRFWNNTAFKSLPKVRVEEDKWAVIGEHPAPEKKQKKKKYKIIGIQEHEDTDHLDKNMFMNWKIPERVTSNDGSARGSTRGSKDDRRSVASKQSVKSEQLPKIPTVVKNKPPDKKRKKKRVHLPDLVYSTPAPSTAKTMTPTKSKTPRLPAKSPVMKSAHEAIVQSLNPQLQRKAKELLESAAPCERRAIEKAVLAAHRVGKQGPGQPRRTYKADTKTAVNRWLDDANDDERALALEFFQSVSASKMMGDSQDKQKRLQQVLSHLESGEAHGVSQSQPGHPMKSDKRGLKTIQLYPDAERRNRWQHTSWHHMPDYRDMDPVNNRSSLYVDSQKIIPRHYTIHPDWGM